MKSQNLHAGNWIEWENIMPNWDNPDLERQLQHVLSYLWIPASKL